MERKPRFFGQLRPRAAPQKEEPMVMTIRTNVSAMNGQRNLQRAQMDVDSALAKLSSGLRITKASDDAAGLGVSTNLTAQVRSYQQAVRNGNDAMSVVQTAEAALNETSSLLMRMRELAMQSASDGVGPQERGYIQTEINEIIAELDRIDAVTEYNGQTLFGAAAPLTFQIGIRATANDFVTLDTTALNVDSATLAVDAVDLSVDATTSRTFLANIDAALDTISNTRSQLGAVANRVASVLNTIAIAVEELSAANSRILDADIAAESTNLAASQVRTQAGVAVLSQANQVPQGLLKLLG
jgi:flagellin